MEPCSPLPTAASVAANPCELDGASNDIGLGVESRSQEPGDSKHFTGSSVGNSTHAAEAARIVLENQKKPRRSPVSALPPPDPRPTKKKRRDSTLAAVPDTSATGPGCTAASPAIEAELPDGQAVVSMGPPMAVTASGVSQPIGAPKSGVPGASTGTDDDTAGAGDERAREIQRLQRELAALREQNAQTKRRLHATVADRSATRKVLASLLVQIAKAEDSEEHDRFVAQRYQLGLCRFNAPCDMRKGTWEGGYESDALTRIKDRIREDKLSIERFRRQLTKHGRSGDEGHELRPDELWEAREISNCRMSNLAREELAVKEREQRLQVDRVLHAKRAQRLEAGERSNFRNHPLLADDRYQLLNMIGRGGFSEVYRAYDLEGNRYCAVKIHELGKEMSDQQRQSYIRRAMREYEIQKTLKHSRVVTLMDCFAISTKAFGTVLELCEGETLDEYMKRYGAFPEREARGIVIQILSGLKYMNTGERKIIHYDLKPGNLFFHGGEVKISDFGLSKIVQESFGESIDLTSQGAGTYWYLPPECFVHAGQGEPPKISNKVDVWSTGVIFFELLFNRRPFGHNQSQEALLRASIAASNPFAVEIPALPKVSGDAKDFLKRVLTINREERPDIFEAFNDPYLRSRSRPSTLSGSAGMVGAGTNQGFGGSGGNGSGGHSGSGPAATGSNAASG